MINNLSNHQITILIIIFLNFINCQNQTVTNAEMLDKTNCSSEACVNDSLVIAKKFDTSTVRFNIYNMISEEILVESVLVVLIVFMFLIFGYLKISAKFDCNRQRILQFGSLSSLNHRTGDDYRNVENVTSPMIPLNQ